MSKAKKSDLFNSNHTQAGERAKILLCCVCNKARKGKTGRKMKYALSQERSASHVREKAFKRSSWKLFRKLCLLRIPQKFPGDLMTSGVTAPLSTSTQQQALWLRRFTFPRTVLELANNSPLSRCLKLAMSHRRETSFARPTISTSPLVYLKPCGVAFLFTFNYTKLEWNFMRAMIENQ